MNTKQLLKTSGLSSMMLLLLYTLFGFTEEPSRPYQSMSTMPIGSIVIWAGEEAPEGWQICRGQRKSKNSNPDLYVAIGGYWNKDIGDNADFFQLPDLRGVFIRGVNGSRDDSYKDTGNRKSVTGKSIYNNTVGSFQSDGFESHQHGGGDHDHGSGNHNHGLSVWDNNNIRNNRASAAYIGNVQRGTAKTNSSGRIIKKSGVIIESEGKNETRPKNAYIHYIIKIR